MQSIPTNDEPLCLCNVVVYTNYVQTVAVNSSSDNFQMCSMMNAKGSRRRQYGAHKIYTSNVAGYTKAPIGKLRTCGRICTYTEKGVFACVHRIHLRGCLFVNKKKKYNPNI